MAYRAMVMTEPGAPLAVEERADPEPGPGQVLVRVRASTLNYHDLVNLQGLIAGPFPRVPMSDGAGEVVAVGPGVQGLAVGDRVTGAFFPAWLAGPPSPEGRRILPGDTGDGWLRELAVADASGVVPSPGHLEDPEAAALACAGVTAWSALRAGQVLPGAAVVVQGTGGVGTIALQLAKAQSATVIVLSSSASKLEAARRLGADHGIDRSADPEWHRRVRELTRGEGADLVVDVGGPATLAQSVAATRMGGTVAVVGLLGGTHPAEVPLARVMTRNIRLVGISVGSVADHRDLTRAVTVAGLRPPIDAIYPWDRSADAVERVRSGAHLGKVGITIG